MIYRVLGVFALLTVAFGILVTSFVKAASIEYNFTQAPSPQPKTQKKNVEVEYYLPYAGSVAPDSPIWPLKVVRDKAWIKLSGNAIKKSETELLVADKRLVSAVELFKKGKADLAVSVLTKAEKYLESAVKQERVAYAQKLDTAPLLRKLSLAALKHRQVIDEILIMAPEDAKPVIITTQNYSKNAYSDIKLRLSELGVVAPTNPFNN